MATETATSPIASPIVAGLPPGGGQPGTHGAASAPVAGSNGGAAELVGTRAVSGGNGHLSSEGLQDEESLPHLSPSLIRLPVSLDVMVPVREFRVRHLLGIAPGTVIESRWGHGEDLPLSSGDVQLAWSEFEVVESRLAVRITRIA